MKEITETEWLKTKCKPCPFCKGKEFSIFEKNDYCWVRCQNLECRAEGPPSEDYDECIKKWNNRRKK